MHTSTLAAALALATLFAADALAQRGGGGRNRWRQPEEITNRVGLFFTEIKGPQSDGDRVADLDTLELVRAAKSAKQLSVVYLSNEDDDERTRQYFEYRLAQSEELGIQLRCFHCGRINLANEAALAGRYGKKAPMFVVFSATGKSIEVSMAGYKPSSTSLRKALEKAASGTIKPSLSIFAKRYANLVEDLEQLLTKKDQANTRLEKAGKDKVKRKKLEKELRKLDAEQQKVLDKEMEMLTKMRLPERAASAKRMGQRPRRTRDRGEGGEEGNGTGRRGGG